LSEIRANTVSNAAGTGPATLTGQSAAKSFCYFNGNGTLAVYTTFNTSSVTDDGVGLYSVNITNSMSDVYYSKIATGGRDSTANQDRWLGLYDATVSSYKVQAQFASGGNQADSQVSAVIHGDLA
jgi:hypothetical protein